MSIFRPRSEKEHGLGSRLPPGQYLTEKWPVLHYGSVPRFDPSTWDLRVFGLVEQPLRLNYDEFMALPRSTTRADVHCVTRWSMVDSEWEGVAVQEILQRARPRPEAGYVLVRAEQNFTTNLPLADLDRPENLFAFRRNGEDISPEHGWPLRLLVPHLYFWKSAKWVRGLELLPEDRAGFWEQYGYHMRGDPWSEERYGWG